ncbi:hypothetical protein Poli38472_014827 [Pythium oligandrum]|uniref:Uncharacterized protein n=1 Tax=Pythium oligandrum TaxID=41045 RepID=A0A8K1C749_PYTOL|nr:hypothetical protein Poli38472_014827 [Pythium oligandrum]|eukprot:TMW57694.1 hypothetical protein Poli38472_014827 [Pythium oligandrum]
MGPSQASKDDIPCLTGADNFDVWKARIRASLNGKGILGYILYENYDDPTLYDDVESESNNSKVKPVSQEPDPDAVDYGSDEELDPRSSSSSSSSSSDESSSAKKRSSSKPPAVKSFAETKAAKQQKKLEAEQQKKLEAEKFKKKKAALRQQREADAFNSLIQRLDNSHVRLVKEKLTAYEFYATICSKYEGVDAHGNPYTIMGFLLNARFKENDNLLKFVLHYEDTFKALDDATGSAMEDTWKSIFL